MSQEKRLTEDPEGYHRRQEQLREANVGNGSVNVSGSSEVPRTTNR